MEWINSKFSIGTLKFPRFIGGPLDGITDSPFRKLVRKYSKEELLYSEMRHVACIANDKCAAKALNFDICQPVFPSRKPLLRTKLLKNCAPILR